MEHDRQQNDSLALLIIDVQRGLFERPTPIYRAEQFIENVNILIQKARQAGAPVIFIQHANEKFLLKGSDAWQLHSHIRPLSGETIIHKRHGNAFQETSLHAEMQSRNVSTLVITGLVTHGCVRATSLGAIELGYRTILVSDAHSSYSKDAPALIEKWNRELNEKGAELRETQAVDFREA